MAKRQPPMRVMQRDIKEYQRLRKNYQAKIRRVKKTTGFNLPDINQWLGVELPHIKDLKSGKAFANRKEFNAWKKQMTEINKRSFADLQIETNAKGMRYPRVVKNQGKAAAKRAQKAVQDRIDRYRDLPVIVEGEEMGTVEQRQLMLTDREAYGLYKPEDFDIDTYVNPSSAEKNIKRNEERQTDEYYDERMERMRDNFAGIFDNLDDEDGQEIAERIRRIAPDDFYEMYLMLPEMSFEDWDSESGSYISGDKSPIDVFGYFLDIYEQGQIDLSLKGIG